MCLLSYYPPGVVPEREHLENGARLNGDSFGFAMIVSGKLVTVHDLDAETAIGEFTDMRRFFASGDAMFHCRKATDTASTLGNAHPFPVGGSPLVTVAHNGYLFPRAGGDDRTDSLVFAQEILPLYSLDKPVERRLLESRLGPNRMVILSVSGRHERSAYILNRDQGITLENGTWHSNAMFLGAVPDGCRLCFAEDAPMVTLPSGALICEDDFKALDTRRALLMEGPSATAWR